MQKVVQGQMKLTHLLGAKQIELSGDDFEELAWNAHFQWE